MLMPTVSVGGGGGGSGMSVVIVPSSSVGYIRYPGTAITMDTATAEVTGGSPPYTYLWEHVSGDANIQPVAPTAKSTKFSAYLTYGPQDTFANYKVTVTDSASVSQESSNQHFAQLSVTDSDGTIIP